MIPVELAPEPPDFDVKVRRPGLSAISELLGQGATVSRPGPRRRAVAKRVQDLDASLLPDYWTRVTEALVAAYDRRCAYACLYIEQVTGVGTVDHWAPKSRAVERAYEWDNYRLACSLMNARKQTFEGLVDPFEVSEGMFALEFGPRIRAVPGPLAGEKTPSIKDTIARLKLDGPDYSAALEEYLGAYERGEVKFEYLLRRAPFLGRELLRQGRVRAEDRASGGALTWALPDPA